MEEKIGELQDYLSNKQQHLLTFTSKNSLMNFSFPVPIELHSSRNYKAGLLWFSAYNTIFNVSKTNNLLHYFYNGSHILALPHGAYEITQINSEINRQLKSKNLPLITIGINHSTSQSTITLPEGVEIDFSLEGSLGSLLGFNQKRIEKGFHRSDNIVQITNISTINIECNLIQNSYINGAQSNIIYSFPSYTVPVGFKIVERISHPIYLPVVNTSSISSIQIRIIDEKQNLINFNGEEISMAIELKQV
jgi:hypothetical protein